MKKLLAIFIVLITAFAISCTNENITTTETEETFPATIKGRVLSGAGDMMTAGIIITYPNGDMERVNTNILSGYTLYLEEGEYTFTFTRGMDYSRESETIYVENYKTYYIDDVRLNQLYDGVSKGWYLGQLHQHSTFSDGKQGVEEVLISNISTGLHFGYLSDHNTARGLPEWVQGNRLVAEYDSSGNPINFIAMRAVEVTTDFGHFQSLGVGNVLEQADINPVKGDVPVDEILEIAQEIARSGAISTINHPFATSVLGFNYWEIAEEFDAIEIWNGLYITNRQENLQAKEKWFELLEDHRQGLIKFLPATSGSDNHDIRGYYTGQFADRSTDEAAYKDDYLKRGLYTNMPSLSVYIEGEFTESAIETAIRNGNSYLTNGPRIVATIGEAIYGETYNLNGDDSIDIDIDLFSRDDISEIRIIKNGDVIETLNLN
ncbi:MAG: CehA/McbA family metallohydrolase, partial [Bacillota bacterium]